MTPQIFVSLLGICIGFVAALFFCIGTARLRNKDIYVLAGTYWNFSRALAEALAAQKADYVCGGLLLVLSFLLQAAGILISESRATISALTAGSALTTVAVVVFTLLGLALWLRTYLIRSARRYIDDKVAREKAAESKE